MRRPGQIFKKTYILPDNIMAQIISSDICDIIRIWGGAAAGFICHPRSVSSPGGLKPDGGEISTVYDYPLVDDDQGSVVLTSSETDPVTWEASTDVENYGNTDWLGDDGTVLSWRGPAGRDFPFDTGIFVSGLTIGDGETTLGEPRYTVFMPYVYQAGEVYATAPQVGVTPAKVLGAAFVADGRLIAVVNNNYQDVPNPAGAVGGFFDEVWLTGGSDGLFDEAKNTGGWRRIGYKHAGRPESCWFFNSSGMLAVNDALTLTVNDDLNGVVFGQIEPVYGSRTNHQEGRSDWGYSQSGQWPGNYPDYAGAVLKGLTAMVIGSELTSNHFDINTENQDLVLYNNGEPTPEVFTISLTSGTQDPWGMGLAVFEEATLSGVNCGCSAPVDVWTRIGFDPVADCVVDGDRRSVTVTRTISCVGTGDATATVTVDCGPNLGTGMGWVFTGAVDYPETTGANCYGNVCTCGFQQGTIYSSGPTLYIETIEACNQFRPDVTDCVCNVYPPLGTYAPCSCSDLGTEVYTTLRREQYTWLCLANYDNSLWHIYLRGNNGPAYVP
jgi:hypothetical protein